MKLVGGEEHMRQSLPGNLGRKPRLEGGRLLVDELDGGGRLCRQGGAGEGAAVEPGHPPGFVGRGSAEARGGKRHGPVLDEVGIEGEQGLLRDRRVGSAGGAGGGVSAVEGSGERGENVAVDEAVHRPPGDDRRRREVDRRPAGGGVELP